MAKDKHKKFEEPAPPTLEQRMLRFEARLAYLEGDYMRYSSGKSHELEQRLDEIAKQQVPILYEAERRLYGYRVHIGFAAYGSVYLHAFTLRGLRRRIERWERKQRRPSVKGCRRV